MREFHTPPVAEAGPAHLGDLVTACGSRTGSALVAPSPHGRPRTGDPSPSRTFSWPEFAEAAGSLAKGLRSSGLQPGDRVGILCRNRPEWTLFDFACWSAGLVTVPLFDTTTDDDLGHVVRDSGMRAALAEDDAGLDRIHAADGDVASSWTLAAAGLDHLIAQGERVSDPPTDGGSPSPDDVATLVYTSGTTAQPKGCVLTHRNLLAAASASAAELGGLMRPGGRTLVVLPLAHVYARLQQVGAVQSGVTLGYVDDIRGLAAALTSFRPTFLVGVPRMYERLASTALQQATADGAERRFTRATTVAIEYSRALADGGSVPLRLRGAHRRYERSVYRPLRESFGGDCTHALCGGAPLGDRLAHFYEGIGLPVLEGYGLTETTAAITANTPDATRLGSVGRPLPGSGVRVADDGELLVRGPGVFAGYHRDQAATDSVLGADGWLHTGDLGEVDDEGFVRITGRKDEILVTAGGKSVAPAALEELVRAEPVVSHCLVVGDQRPFVAALVTLDLEAAQAEVQRATAAEQANPRRMSRRRGTPALDRASLAEHPAVRELVQNSIDRANESVSRAEAIRAFRIVHRDWTEEGGEVTPSLKLRRRVVTHRHHDEIEALYR